MLARVIVSAMLAFAFGQQVFAGCTCSQPGRSCGRGWSTEQVIFLGKVIADITTEAQTVEDSEPEGSERSLRGSAKVSPMNHAVHFIVADSFRGDAQPGQEIVVHTGVDERGPQDGDCTYAFVVGVSYLVYASTVGDSILTSQCTLTSPEVAAGGVLRELRAIRDGQPVDSLFGTVSLLSPRADLSSTEIQPIAEATVWAIDSRGLERPTKTDERGVYAFEWLPPDQYRIEYELPTGLRRAAPDGTDETLTFELTNEDRTGSGCRADIRVRPEAQASTADKVSAANDVLEGTFSDNLH